MIRIAICDDHAVLRAGIISLLSPDMTCVLNAGSLDDYLAQYKQVAPDVSVIDLNLTDAPGASVITAILDQFPDARLIVFSVRDSLPAIAACYSAAAAAFVSKGDDPAYLIEAIRRVNNHGKYFTPGMGERLTLHKLCGTDCNPKHVLKQDEMTIFLMVAKGDSQQEVAKVLEISTKTVRNKITLIQSKLNEPAKQWLAIALRNNLISGI